MSRLSGILKNGLFCFSWRRQNVKYPILIGIIMILSCGLALAQTISNYEDTVSFSTCSPDETICGYVTATDTQWTSYGLFYLYQPGTGDIRVFCPLWGVPPGSDLVKISPAKVTASFIALDEGINCPANTRVDLVCSFKPTPNSNFERGTENSRLITPQGSKNIHSDFYRGWGPMECTLSALGYQLSGNGGEYATRNTRETPSNGLNNTTSGKEPASSGQIESWPDAIDALAADRLCQTSGEFVWITACTKDYLGCIDLQLVDFYDEVYGDSGSTAYINFYQLPNGTVGHCEFPVMRPSADLVQVNRTGATAYFITPNDSGCPSGIEIQIECNGAPGHWSYANVGTGNAVRRSSWSDPYWEGNAHYNYVSVGSQCKTTAFGYTFTEPYPGVYPPTSGYFRMERGHKTTSP